MSENVNKKGSKRAAVKSFFRKTLGRDEPWDRSPAPSANASTHKSSQAELTGPSTGSGILSSAGVPSFGHIGATPISYASTTVPRSPTTDIGMPSLAAPGSTPSGKIEVGARDTSFPPVPVNSPAASEPVGAPMRSRTTPVSNDSPVQDSKHTNALVLATEPHIPPSRIVKGSGALSVTRPTAVPVLATEITNPRSATSASRSDQRGPDLIVPQTRYHALAGSPAPITGYPSLGAHAKDVMTTTLEGVATVAQGLYDCSDLFLPLKAAAGIFLTIYKNIDKVIENRATLEELDVRLKAILVIVQDYMTYGASEGLKFRIESFCSAIDQHMKEIKHLSDHSPIRRIAEGSKDAQIINKVINSINILCDIFQMDTQLHFSATVVQNFHSAILKELYQRGTTYTARNSSYGEVGGCMPGTRVKLLDGLTSWAFDPTKAKIYWLAGMAGTGKSTIAHSFCEILEGYNMLGASFFCSRASTIASDAGCIIPGIAYQLASSSPAIKAKVVETIEERHELVEPTYWSMVKQFSGLISEPIKKCIKSSSGLYKVVVIDALDECFDQQKAANFVRTILGLINHIPLKILVASREGYYISLAFNSAIASLDTYFLHNVEKDIVRDDISLYLQTALNRIHKMHHPQSVDSWPSSLDLSVILDQCGVLFIYAATIVRYIQNGEGNYHKRLTAITSSVSKPGSQIQTKPIDDLYTQILEQACDGKEKDEVAAFRSILSAIIFLNMPLSAKGLAEILDMEVEVALVSLKTVIFVPLDNGSLITIFHASFPDFVTNLDHCRSSVFPALIEETSQELLALQCLKLMNKGLRYNICGIPEKLIQSGIYQSNPENNGQISEALGYACTHWAIHLTKLSEINNAISIELSVFLENHLLHWFECLSILQKLESSIDMLRLAEDFYAKTKQTPFMAANLIKDGRKLIQQCFLAVNNHCFEAYHSVLVWLPKYADMRQKYAVPIIPQVRLGFSEFWSEVELDIKAEDGVVRAVFSPDGELITGALQNGKVVVWNSRTGQKQTEWQSHTDAVYSLAYSPDGKYITSGSEDGTVKIWDSSTGEIWTELQEHAGEAHSVTFSPDGKFLASGSEFGMVKIWKVSSGEVQAALQSHPQYVLSVGYSPGGKFIASGSADTTVKIWDVDTGKLHATLQGHTDHVHSIAYSPDGRFITSGSKDKTIKVWNTNTKQMSFELLGHTDTIRSVACSPDGKFIVSGSHDQTVRIWNIETRTEKARLVGHTYRVCTVSYSPDGQYIISAGADKTIKLWYASATGIQAQLEGHDGPIYSIEYSPDGRYIASASWDKVIKIWDIGTGHVEIELRGHSDIVHYAAYSPDGKFIVSASKDETIKIWDISRGKAKLTLRGHTDEVNSVLYSQDGKFIASASEDETVRIWDATTGQQQAKFQGDKDVVNLAKFSPDGKFIASPAKNGIIKVWDTSTGRIHFNLQGHTDTILLVEYSPDGRFIASGSFDASIWIWDANTGEVLATLLGHTGAVEQAYFSKDGNILLSCSADKTIRKWNLSNLVNGKKSSPTSSVLCNFQSGWLMIKDKSHWIPIHDIYCFAVHGNMISMGTHFGQVFCFDCGVDPFTM